MLEIGIFTFSHNVFYPTEDKIHLFASMKSLSVNILNLGKSKILKLGYM